MGLLSFQDFLGEEEKVKLDKDLREYTLTHMKNDRFQLKSDNFFKEFSVLPYKSEIQESLRKAHSKLEKAIDSMNAEELYSAVLTAESAPYDYGGIYTSHFSFSQIPSLMTSLDADQQQALASSEREFLLNNFSQLGKSIKDEILESLRERAEILCCVIEALFYYIRTIDKDNYYQGMNSEEIVEEFETQIEKSSKEASFSFRGPFADNSGESDLSDTSTTAFWKCEKDMKVFYVQSTIQPKQLYNEENIGGTKGLKFSLTLPDDKTPEKNFSFFPIEDLTTRVKTFYEEKLKK
jgi:hypothetical protein